VLAGLISLIAEENRNNSLFETMAMLLLSNSQDHAQTQNFNQTWIVSLAIQSLAK